MASTRTPEYVAQRVYAVATGTFKFTPTRDQMVTAVAIAMAEDTTLDVMIQSKKNKDGSVDRGLWQINSSHQHEMDTYNSLVHTKARWPDGLFDPTTNTAMMIIISNELTNWQPWTTYRTGAYQKFLTPAGAAVDKVLTHPNQEVPGDPGSADHSDLLDPIAGGKDLGGALIGAGKDAAKKVFSGIDAVGNFFNILGDVHTWVRVLMVAGGLGLAFWAFVSLSGGRGAVAGALKAAA